MIGKLFGRAAVVVVTGAVGAATWDGAKRVARSGAVRRGAVGVTAWGLRGARAAEVGAERVRLATADIVSEARERIGEESRPPGNGGLEHSH